MRQIVSALGVMIVLGTVGCGDSEQPEPGLPNPASVYCVDNGGRLEIRQDSEGGQVGICVFPDGSECDEWDFFRGDCGPKTS